MNVGNKMIICFTLTIFLGSVFVPGATVTGEPRADQGVMVDFELVENETHSPSWTLGDVFYDDVDPDPDFTYSVSNNGSLWIHCQNDLPLGPNNQCEDIMFVAVDGSFSMDIPVAITFTATNGTGGSASDQLVVTVKHVNHMPEVIPGVDDEYEMDEDTTDTINLRDCFRDMDVGDPSYPTNDALVYDRDGNEHIEVTITGSKVKLEPEGNWHGQEIITFTAVDNAGGSADFDLTVIVKPVNDEPVLVSLSPVLDPSEDEMDNGTSNTVEFEVQADDVDGDDLEYDWTVEDAETGMIVTPVVNGSNIYEMKLGCSCDFASFVFCGRDSSATYIVTTTVSDGVVTVELKKWFITVRNVNREPLIEGVKVSEVDPAGSVKEISPTSPGNYTLKYGKVYRFDIRPFVTDLDEGIVGGEPSVNLNNLSIEWASDKTGPLGSDVYIDVAAGKSSALASATLALRRSVVTCRVTDPDGGVSQYLFTVKVETGVPDLGVEFVKDGDSPKNYEVSGATGEQKEIKVKIVVRNTGDGAAENVHVEVRDEDGDKLGDTTIERLDPKTEKVVAVKIKVRTGETTGPMSAEVTTTFDDEIYTNTTTEGAKATVVQTPGFDTAILLTAIIFVLAVLVLRGRR
jgi:hypothetical protein